jgi:hypothetical protein
MATFSFNGRISATFRIRNRSYTLTSDSELSEVTNIRLVYHETFDQALIVGTIQEIVQDLVDAQEWALHLVGDPEPFNGAKLSTLLDQAKALPGFGEIYNRVDDVQVKITDLVLELSVPEGGAANLPPGNLTIGFGFDLRNEPVANRTLLGITLESVGILVEFEVGEA